MPSRPIRTDCHDDGVNAWRMTHFAPDTRIAGLVRGYSDYEERTGGFTTRRELPHGDGVMIVNLGDPIAITGGDGREIALNAGEAFVAGVHLRPAFSNSNGAQRGIHVFLPIASIRRLLGVPMDELVDRVVPLDALLGADARRIGAMLGEAVTMDERAALLDAALTRRFADSPALRGADRHALSLVIGRHDLDLAEVARSIGWSRKHLACRIRDTVGIGPRSFRRVLRFARAVTAASDRDASWAGVAADCGYSDQPHLIREFREFAGLSPTAFRAQLLGDGGGLIEH